MAAWRIEDAMRGIERPVPQTKSMRAKYLDFTNMAYPEQYWWVATHNTWSAVERNSYQI